MGSGIAAAKLHYMECMACGKTCESWGLGFDAAFFDTPRQHPGWIIRRGPLGEHYLYCPDHHDVDTENPRVSDA